MGQPARHANLVNLEQNGGPAAARNAGAARGGRELILFLDDDVTVDDIDDLVTPRSVVASSETIRRSISEQ